jgi:uncharacterized protein
MSVESPCINVCVLDTATGHCTGCLRSLDEIAGWATFSDDERRAVWDALARRRASKAGDEPSSDERRPWGSA